MIRSPELALYSWMDDPFSQGHFLELQFTNIDINSALRWTRFCRERQPGLVPNLFDPIADTFILANEAVGFLHLKIDWNKG